MKHKLYDRILHNAYIKVNAGLQNIQDAWGYGCPLGMDSISFQEMEYDRNKQCTFNKLGICIEDYLYKSEEDYNRFLKSVEFHENKRVFSF